MHDEVHTIAEPCLILPCRDVRTDMFMHHKQLNATANAQALEARVDGIRICEGNAVQDANLSLRCN